MEDAYNKKDGFRAIERVGAVIVVITACAVENAYYTADTVL
jgi:hypothetical protein